jgi:hypothetical protein
MRLRAPTRLPQLFCARRGGVHVRRHECIILGAVVRIASARCDAVHCCCVRCIWVVWRAGCGGVHRCHRVSKDADCPAEGAHRCARTAAFTGDSLRGGATVMCAYPAVTAPRLVPPVHVLTRSTAKRSSPTICETRGACRLRRRSFNACEQRTPPSSRRSRVSRMSARGS